MSTRRLLPLLSLAVAVLGGCAGPMTEARRAHICSYDTAFEDGVNEARGGFPMNSGVEVCDATKREEAARGYREGYQVGLASRASEQRSVPHRHPGGRGYVCDVSGVGDTFTASGRTEEEARAAAKAKCKEEHLEGSCWPVTCRQDG